MDVGADSFIYKTQRDVNIVVVGLEGSGKTSIITSLLGEDISLVSTTYGVNQDTLNVKGLSIGLTDLGGKEPFRKTLWKHYIEQADGLIYVVDGTKKAKLKEAELWFKQVCNWSKKDIPMLVLINTWDKNVSEKTILKIKESFLNIAYSCKDFTSIYCFDASPITKKNLYQAMDWLATTIIERFVKAEIIVESFIAHVKVEGVGVLEAKIIGYGTETEVELLLTLIKNRFTSEEEKLLEYLHYKNKQILLAADNTTSCAIVTNHKYGFKETNLLLYLLSDFMKKIQGWEEIRRKDVKESELTELLTKHVIDKQDFWNIMKRPIFEISYLENQEK